MRSSHNGKHLRVGLRAGDLVRWKKPEHRTGEFEGKVGIVVEVGELDHLAANKLPLGAYIYWPGKGIYWTPVEQLEIINERRP